MSITEKMRNLALDVASDLGLTTPFTAHNMIAAIEAQWTIPIVLHPFRAGSFAHRSRITGWCRYREEVLHIHYYASGSVIQQERILYHELGHMLCNHVQPYSRHPRKRPGIERNLEEIAAEAFAEVMSELAIIGDVVEGPPTRAVSAGYQDPYTRFLVAQE
jgi:hypothetical protein